MYTFLLKCYFLLYIGVLSIIYYHCYHFNNIVLADICCYGKKTKIFVKCGCGCYERRRLFQTLSKAVNYHLCYKWSHISPACRRPLIQTNHRRPAQSPVLSTLSFSLPLPHTHMNISRGKGAVMRGFILSVSLIYTETEQQLLICHIHHSHHII